MLRLRIAQAAIDFDVPTSRTSRQLAAERAVNSTITCSRFKKRSNNFNFEVVASFVIAERMTRPSKEKKSGVFESLYH